MKFLLTFLGLVVAGLLPSQTKSDAEGQRGIVLAKRAEDGRVHGKVDQETYVFGRYHALLIAIQDYPRPFPSLKTPRQDIRRLRQVLKHHYGFSQVALLEDSAATRRGILRAIGAYRQRLGDHDNLLIYFAGHGVTDKFGDHFWLPFDAEQDATSWVSAARIKQLIRRIKARHTLLISDSCFSGAWLRSGVRKIRAPRAIRNLHRKNSYLLLTSGGLEPVADGGKQGCSLFAWNLIQRLERNPDPFKTIATLAIEVQADVAGADGSKQTPEFGQIPGTDHDFGQFVFARTTGPSTLTARAAVPELAGWPRGWLPPPGVEHRSGRYFSTGKDKAEMVLIPGGTVRLPGHEGPVRIDPFLIDKFEVTNSRFRIYLQQRTVALRSVARWNERGFDKPQQPAVFVNLNQARAFSTWAGKRLPSEQQWLFAAAVEPSGKLRRFPWGNRFEDAGFERRMHPPLVTDFPKDASPWNVQGMAGGVREWCEQSPRDMASGTLRGGTHYLMRRRDQLAVPATWRQPSPSSLYRGDIGFRCVLPLRRP